MREPPERDPDDDRDDDPGSEQPPGPVVELGPPISDVPWSSEFAQQSLEVLILLLEEGSVAWLKPVHADSLHVGLPVSSSPGDVVIETLGWFGLTPRVVHSTSWRHEDGRLVLTYIAVVEPPSIVPQDALRRVEVARADLARGDATAPPSEIGVSQVIEHALRHLSWLFRDDPAIAEALPDWVEVLGRYQPEPFRALG